MRVVAKSVRLQRVNAFLTNPEYTWVYGELIIIHVNNQISYLYVLQIDSQKGTTAVLFYWIIDIFLFFLFFFGIMTLFLRFFFAIMN